MNKNIGTVYLYNIDTLHIIILTVHGTSTFRRKSIVKAGARLSNYCNLLKQKKQEGMEKLRQDLIETGKIVDGVLKEDYKFSSTSTAAAVILGTAISGNEKWKDANGVSLGELRGNAKS